MKLQRQPFSTSTMLEFFYSFIFLCSLLVLFLTVYICVSLFLSVSNHSLYIYFTTLLFCYCRIPHFSSFVCISKTSSPFFPTPTLTHRHMQPKQANRSGMFTITEPKNFLWDTVSIHIRGKNAGLCVCLCGLEECIETSRNTQFYHREEKKTAVMWYYRPHGFKTSQSAIALWH